MQAVDRNLKRRITRILCVPLAAVCLTVAVAEPVWAKRSVPLVGFIQAVETSSVVLPPEVPFPTLIVDASGSGRATHLGRFEVAYEVEVNLDTFFGIGAAQFTAANGDTISTELEGQGTVPTDDGISFIEETHVITGGTGRFKGAGGSFTIERVVNVFSGVTYGWIEGTINRAK